MRNIFCTTFIISLCFLNGQSQVERLPVDLRQHNLTHLNASLLSPVFSLETKNEKPVTLWTRWQWQSIDADPTTLYLSYFHPISEESVLGGGYFQNNTGIYINRGGVINYAYSFNFKNKMRVDFGVNLFGFTQNLANITFQPDPQVQLPQLETSNSFVLQLAPALRFSIDNLGIGITSENLYDYNVTAGERETLPSEKIYLGFANYKIPVNFLGSGLENYIQPTIYIKDIPNFDTQYGFTALASGSTFWAQAGYNSFYGISTGVGGRFFKRFSFGALIEFGKKTSIGNSDTTFELLSSYVLGSRDPRKKVIGFEKETQEAIVWTDEEEVREKEEVKNIALEDEELNKAVQRKERKEAKAIARMENLQKKEQARDSMALLTKEVALVEEMESKQRNALDSINEIRKKEALAVAEQRRQEQQDSVKEEKLRLKEAEEIAEALKRKKQTETRAEKEKLQQEERLRDSVAMVRKEQSEAKAKQREAQRVLDSINAVRLQQAQEGAKVAAEKQREDSLSRIKVTEQALNKKIKVKADSIPEVVAPLADEKYEEVKNEGGLEPGYYLIANVFGTKKYYEGFMETLSKKGLAPKSFFRSVNKYNYVYLQRYDSISDARKARDSQFNGRYGGSLWIFRVIGN